MKTKHAFFLVLLALAVFVLVAVSAGAEGLVPGGDGGGRVPGGGLPLTNEAVTLGKTCLSFGGFSVRTEGTVAIRAEFLLDEAAIANAEGKGYTVEITANLSFGETAASVAFYRGGVNGAFVIGKEEGGKVRMGFAAEYRNATPEQRATVLSFSGGVALTDGEGNVTRISVPASASAAKASVLSLYGYLVHDLGYEGNAFVRRAYERSYRYRTVMLDAERGSDENDGERAPVRTFARAYELLDGWMREPSPLDVTFDVAAGKYVVEDTLEINASAYANRDVRLHFVGAENDGSVITSCTPLCNAKWEEVPGEDYYRYSFDPDEDGNYPVFRFFYANGAMQKDATQGYDRTYDAETERERRLILSGETYYMNKNHTAQNMFRVPYDFDGLDNPDPNPARKLYLPEEAFAGMTDEDFATGQVEMVISIAWYMRILHIDRIDREDCLNGNVAAFFVEEEMKDWNAAHSFAGAYFWLRGAKTFLDEYGEYFYDRANGVLYYNPAEGVDIETAVLEIPQLDDVTFGFIGMNDVTFDGLTFYGNDNRICMEQGQWYNTSQATATRSARYGNDAKAVLFFQHSSRVTVKNCLFHDIAASGIKFTGLTRRAVIDSNRLFHVGCSGIELGWHNNNWNLKTGYGNEDCVIRNNVLDDIATFTYGSVGIYISVSRNLELCYNTVMNTSYSAVSIGWRWEPGTWELGEYYQTYHADIHHNYFRGFMSDLSDGGAIYTLGGNVNVDYHEYFNELHDNYCWVDRHTWDGKGMVMPWYHDGGSSNWHTYGNIEVTDPYRTMHALVYLQNSPKQDDYNILVEENDFFVARTDWEDYSGGRERTEHEVELLLFGQDYTRPMDGTRVPTRVDPERFLSQRNNRVWDHPGYLSDEMIERIEACGSSLCPADPYEMMDVMSTIYDLFYAELEEKFISTLH